jgi:polyisoprenoid-binding protein YceI
MSTISPSKTTPAGAWSADPVHSHVSFEVAYAGTNTFRGGFHEYTATLEDGVIEGSAKVASVDVKDEQLNGHLLTPDFFDPSASPRSRSARATSSTVS